jgi:hypothetical protein
VNASTILLVIALILFVAAAVGAQAGRLNLVAAGLACLTATMLV